MTKAPFHTLMRAMRSVAVQSSHTRQCVLVLAPVHGAPVHARVGTARSIQPNGVTAIANTGMPWHGICRAMFSGFYGMRCPRNNQQHDDVYGIDRRRSTLTLFTAKVRRHRDADTLLGGIGRRCTRNSRMRQHMHHAACRTRCMRSAGMYRHLLLCSDGAQHTIGDGGLSIMMGCWADTYAGISAAVVTL